MYENVAFGLEVIGRPRQVIRTQVRPSSSWWVLAVRLTAFPMNCPVGTAAGVHCSGFVKTLHLSCWPTSRRGKPGPSDFGWHHASAGSDQPQWDHRGKGHPLTRGIVDTMRRRVIELDRGVIRRDESQGVYE
ncbi:MAG: hypothetical protein CM1200mP26_17970 [Acidimicrobiales bacterium]|nr:MAG: hypothetical protein CM1200mP26_17970 [Acidimicrobiales bacterium]